MTDLPRRLRRLESVARGDEPRFLVLLRDDAEPATTPPAGVFVVRIGAAARRAIAETVTTCAT